MFFFFFSSRRRHTRCREVSWARRCVQETGQGVYKKEEDKFSIEEAIKKEPQLSLLLENKELVIDYLNLKEVRLHYYLIDLEILFSRTPFLETNVDNFSFLQPNFGQNIKLPEKERRIRIKIPDIFSNKNVIIEATGGSLQQRLTFFSSSLTVQIFEPYGELKVLDDAKPLPQLYIKVFALRKNNSSFFYKDGYTDIRGRFNYVSVNSSLLSTIQKFAILVHSESKGSLVKECFPPALTLPAANCDQQFQ
eukprot:TRINITY_DN57994_c0_g1_i2.p1 TRINITY_DN57994_c0_g1~~TRINITY_DN57994_c0_g1_i2.p1  ORF type:complete len:250 (+),score=61.87 TRINITY_DN57994_c0_g1_i2:99-848(+)